MFTAPTVLPDDPAALQLILHAALAEIERLRLLIAGLQRNRFGRRSERLDDATFQQGVEDLEQSLAEQSGQAGCGQSAAGNLNGGAGACVRLAANRPSATVARCRRICRGSRW